MTREDRAIRAPWWDDARLAALAAVALICALGPWWGVYEFDTDEGVNLMKGVLVAAGYNLYGEIWSDQPPVFSVLLTGVQAAFGYSVPAARGLVLAFSAALVWGLYRIVRRDCGGAAAWAAVACLISGYGFQRLGVSVLIGLPSLALAVLALERLTAPGAGRGALWLSALLMAASLQTKLFSGAWLPGLLLAATLGVRGSRAVRMVEWSAVLVVGFGAIMIVSGPGFLDQMIRPHLEASANAAFRYGGGPNKLWAFLVEQPQYLILGGVGLLMAPPGVRGFRWVPILWLACGAAVLWDHRPLWIHHLPLLTVPLAWLAGGVAAGFGRDEPGWLRRIHSGISLAVIAAALPFAVVQAADTAATFRRAPDPVATKAVELLKRRAAATRWVLTDRPMDAYRAGLPVPPPVAVYTLKRVKTGRITEDRLLGVLRDYVPEQVSYRRFFMGKRVRKYLARQYVKIPGLERHALYVLPSLR